jgi:hypothetical protein
MKRWTRIRIRAKRWIQIRIKSYFRSCRGSKWSHGGPKTSQRRRGVLKWKCKWSCGGSVDEWWSQIHIRILIKVKSGIRIRIQVKRGIKGMVLSSEMDQAESRLIR